MTLRRIDRQKRGCAAVAIAVVLSLLGGCASTPLAPVVELSQPAANSAADDSTQPARAAGGAETYHVVRGDTLHTIAFKHGLDYRDIAAWNGIVPPYRIFAGQDLRLTPPASAGSRSAGVAAAAPQVPKAAPAPPPKAAPAASAPAVASAAPAPNSPRNTAPLFEDVTTEPAMPADIGKTPVPSSTASSTPAVATATPAARPESTAKTATASIGIKGAAAAEPAASKSVPPPTDAGSKQATTDTPSKIVEDSVATSANGLAWRWPGKGALAGTFVAGDQTRQGIDIAGKAGDPVLAAGDGEVVYSGNGLLGYGELIIVKHNASFLSAYGHNRKRLVQEGDKVKAGQQIAEMGSSASSRDELHFEIRKNGKPVNPLDYLPAR
jgi:lipoprotein NlpD